MDWRSLLFFKAADLHVLDAPGYDERIQVNEQEVQNLLINNKHSQPALLHLSTYTDVMNIFQYDASDAYFGPRSDVNQRRMSLAVKSAVLLSALTVVAVVIGLDLHWEAWKTDLRSLERPPAGARHKVASQRPATGEPC